MKKRIFWSIFSASLAVLVLVTAFIVLALYNTYETNARDDLRTEAHYINSKLLNVDDEIGYINGYYSLNRITVIASDGTVLYDNTVDAASMENHADRPEVVSALVKGAGESIRYSSTLLTKTLNYAVKTPEGNVVRISKTQSSAIGLLWDIIPVILIIGFGVVWFSAVMSRLLTKRIIAPINSLNLDAPCKNDTYDELGPLLLRLERQREELERKMLEITKHQREFEAVTENMNEGLILLSLQGDILSINRSAMNIFGVENSIGKPALALNRSTAFQEVAECALMGAKGEAHLTINNRHYQLLGSPVQSKDGLLGAVILIMDITDKQAAERSRKEFTDNISHELKTPLTSISGYAEIMTNGTARPEDMKGFAARIHQEAGRLITLVDDILRLAQLDEQAGFPDKEDVDLYALAEDVISRLYPLAEQRNVSVSLEGERVVISGYRKILEEMVYNLCDNAIKYNIPGGSVNVGVKRLGEKVVVSVADTGIGIPEKHQPHVFERFYRVDKSRSKETGGTGLGLSIVKHGVIIHGAEIKLNSSPGAGTKIEIFFPNERG